MLGTVMFLLLSMFVSFTLWWIEHYISAWQSAVLTTRVIPLLTIYALFNKPNADIIINK